MLIWCVRVTWREKFSYIYFVCVFCSWLLNVTCFYLTWPCSFSAIWETKQLIHLVSVFYLWFFPFLSKIWYLWLIALQLLMQIIWLFFLSAQNLIVIALQLLMEIPSPLIAIISYHCCCKKHGHFSWYTSIWIIWSRSNFHRTSNNSFRMWNHFQRRNTKLMRELQTFSLLDENLTIIVEDILLWQYWRKIYNS